MMSLCRGGRWMFRTTHFTIHSMPSRTPLLRTRGGEVRRQAGHGAEAPSAMMPAYPVRAEQAWVRQSRRPILQVQSLSAVLISGMERHGWGRRGREQQHASPLHTRDTHRCGQQGEQQGAADCSCVPRTPTTACLRHPGCWCGLTSTSCLLASTSTGTPSSASLVTTFSTEERGSTWYPVSTQRPAAVPRVACCWPQRGLSDAALGRERPLLQASSGHVVFTSGGAATHQTPAWTRAASPHRWSQ